MLAKEHIFKQCVGAYEWHFLCCCYWHAIFSITLLLLYAGMPYSFVYRSYTYIHTFFLISFIFCFALLLLGIYASRCGITHLYSFSAYFVEFYGIFVRKIWKMLAHSLYGTAEIAKYSHMTLSNATVSLHTHTHTYLYVNYLAV